MQMYYVYSPSRFSYMSWTLCNGVNGWNLKPACSLQALTLQDAEELAKAVGDGELQLVVPQSQDIQEIDENYW